MAATSPLAGGRASEIEARETSVDGYRMHSLRAVPLAEPSGSAANIRSAPHLILLHGILGAASCWRPVMQLLASTTTVTAVDALGVGASERVPGLDASMRASAGRLARFMDAERIEQADLAGTSHGGAVAMTFAAMYPERVRSLVLHAPANPFCRRSRPSVRFYCTPFGQWVARRMPSVPRAWQTIAHERMYGDPKQVQVGALENYVESLKVPGTTDYILSVLHNWFHDMTELTRLLPRLKPIPTRVLWGTHDRAVSLDSGRQLAQALDAELVLLEGAGHVPYEEVPETYADQVTEFLSRQSRMRAPVRSVTAAQPCLASA